MVQRIVSVDLPNTKVIEKNGNPLIVSAIVVYSIQNAKRATIGEYSCLLQSPNTNPTFVVL